MIVIHANHLVSLGHEVRITTAVMDTVFALDPRVMIKTLPSKTKLGTVLSALRMKFSSDVVIADIIPMVCFLSVRNRKKVLCFAQDYDESYYTSVIQKSLIRSLYFIGLRLFRVPAMAVSHPLADLLRARYGARVAVAENGVDTGVFYSEPDPDLCVEKETRRAVLLLSRSDQRKGFDLAQEVVKRLSESHAGLFEVWTVGEPCAGLFPDLVHRDFGYVREENLRRIMSSADFFLYPTRHEGLPLMPLESLACGCPVVTTTAVPYGGDDARSMKISAIGDVGMMTRNLKELIDNDGQLAEFKRYCQDVVDNHDIARCKRQFEQVLVAGIGEIR